MSSVAFATSAPTPTFRPVSPSRTIPHITESLSKEQEAEQVRASILQFSQIVWEDYDGVIQQHIFAEAGRRNLLDVNSALAESERLNKDHDWVVDQLNALLSGKL